MNGRRVFVGGWVSPRGKLAVGALLLAWASLLASALRAESVLPVPTAAGSDVSIKVALVSRAAAARFGFAPVRVSIENSAAQERSWRIQFQSGSRGTFPGPVAFERTITVPAGQTRDTWLYVPVADPGTPGGNPILSSGGITAGAAPVATPKVTINRTFNGTQIIKVTPSSGIGGPVTEDITIDGTTGEMKTVTTSGGTSSTRTSSVPSGTAVTYRIDSGTGAVMRTFTPIASSGIGSTPKVNIVTDPPRVGGPSSASIPTTPTRVTIDPTPVGMKVTRILGTSGKTGRSYTEEREIDTTTGVITTTMTSPAGSIVSSRASPPLNSGTETTFTINSVTGAIGTSTRIGSNPSAPPKVTLVTSANPSGGGSPASMRPGAAPGSRLVSSQYNGPPMQLSFEVSGPGLTGTNRLSFPSLGSTANMRPWAATLALERVLREGLNNEGIRTPNLAAVEVAQLPADWRVWSSFASLFIQVDEFATLDAARRAALRGWVALGGQLYLSPSDPGQRTIEALGAGTIVTLAAPLTVAPTAADLLLNGISLGGSPGHPDSDALLVRATSGLGEAIAERETSSTWLTIFLILFAAVIGPVNLYVFAPAAKRHRLFITTPLISLVAAIILGLTILGQDGAGGDGVRRALVVFVPGDNQAAVFQEQAARTGFLTSQSFALAGDTQLTSLPLEDAAMGRMNFSNTPDLSRDEARASGTWFRSRGRQAHLLQRLVPTRGRVERVGTAADGAPIVQSSLPGVLRDFVCVDEKGGMWFTRELAPGKRATLEVGGPWITRLRLGGTNRFSQILTAAAPATPGHWGAKGGEGELAPIATLAAVRWKQPLEVVYTGMLEGVAVEKTEAKR